MNENKLPKQPKETEIKEEQCEKKENKKKRIRYKEYKCVYPNCDEKPKTKIK